MGGELEPWVARLHTLPLSNDERGRAYVHIMTNDNMKALLANENATSETCVSAVRELLRLAAAAAQPSASPQVDASPDICWALVGPELAAPPLLPELHQFMTTPPVAKIPTTRSAMQLIRNHPIAAHFTVADGRLAEIVGHSICLTHTVGSPSEVDTVILEHTTVVQVIQTLDNALASGHRIGLQVERDKGDDTSLMTLVSPSGRSLRPDGVMRTLDGLRMLAKWEDKGPNHAIHDAVADLQAKTAAWTPLYYGNAQYLPCFAAAGSILQFYAIPRDLAHQPVPITPCVSMMNPEHRAELAMYCVKFYQLLKAQKEAYPAHVLPAAKDLVAVTGAAPEQVTRTLHFRTDRVVVQKRIQPWSLYARWTGTEVGELAAVYQATASAQGLVHAVAGPQVDDDKYTVVLQPVGLPHTAATPRDEEGLRRAAHALLHALAAIHAAGFVHRDLRWPNVAAAYDKTRWFLLDLEMCVRVDRACQPARRPPSWTTGTLVGNSYVAASDLYQLGRMLQDHRQHVSSAEGLQFMSLLASPAQELHDRAVTAQSLLAHAWLQCPGVHCAEVGAQPGETGG